jgi:HD superfamily phosphohydrolase
LNQEEAVPAEDQSQQQDLEQGDETGPAEEAAQMAMPVGRTAGPSQETDPNALLEETLLPVHGMVRLAEREMEIVDHPAFQRLFSIFQLGQTHVVYRGATHMRGEHALGSLQSVATMAEAIERNRARGEPESTVWRLGEALSAIELAFVRLGALLHDIGHLPAGHTLEDELGLLPPHDADKRMVAILEKTDWHGREYESLGARIDRLYADDAQVAAQRDDDGELLVASDLVLRLVSRDHKGASSTPGTSFRLGICRDLIGNTICADLLDYIHRDWHHLGKQRHFDPRLLDYVEVRTRQDETTGEHVDRLVINLRGGSRPRPDAVTAILDLLESRYQLTEIALFHRVKLAAAGMLERVIAEYRDTFPDLASQRAALENTIPALLECTDPEMLKLFEVELARRRNSGDAERVDGAIDLARRLLVRQLHRDLRVFYEDDVGGEVRAKWIAKRYAGDPERPEDEQADDLARAADYRLQVLRRLEEDFGLDPGALVLYCPSLRMNHKIAEVGIYVDGDVDTLAVLEQRITGGHLRAQLIRFRRLWRIAFSIDRGSYTRLEKTGELGRLIEAIRLVVLGIRPETGTVADAVRALAEAMTINERSPWSGGTVVEPAMNRTWPTVFYPGGIPSIRSHIAID